MTNEWFSERLTYISALKNPSDAQKLLLEIAQIQYRTPEQEKKLNALIKAEKAIDRANKQKVVVRKLLNAEKEAERKARTRHLIQLGALFEIANLDKRDPAELLGILLKTAEIDPNDMKWQIWKDLGQEVLNQRKRLKNKIIDYAVKLLKTVEHCSLSKRGT